MNIAGSRSPSRPEISPRGARVQGLDSSPLQKGKRIFIRKSELSKEINSVRKVFIFLNMVPRTKLKREEG